ncbi:MAG TPA: reverse transcriptase-like protein, partial [Bacteroidota bacterium]|nr:reverse transcriptase-like protein [Bacteroidota bacterium]
SDSELMVRQIQGTYRVRDANLKTYYARAIEQIRSAAYQFTIVHVDRSKNKEADRLANEAIDGKDAVVIS